MEFMQNYDSAITIGQLSVPDFISLMLFVSAVSYGFIVMSDKVLDLLISSVRFIICSIRKSRKEKEKHMNLLTDGCDDDLLFFPDGTWYYRHELRGIYDDISPDELAGRVFIVVSPHHDGYDEFVAADKTPLCL